MSQTYFSKLDSEEKESRLERFGSSKGTATVWIKGKDTRYTCKVISYHKDFHDLIVEFTENIFPVNSQLLCSFELRGSIFFTQVSHFKSYEGRTTLTLKHELFKSERRTSYRLLIYPIYDVWAEFDLGEVYEGGKVISLKSRVSQTNLFKNFLKLVDPNKDSDSQIKKIKLRIQDFSTTGMAIHVGDLESTFFSKEVVFQNVKIKFIDDFITVPELKVVYIIDYIGTDKYASKYKVGLHFTKMDHVTDEKIGRKINSLLREVDFNLDFEKFVK